MSLIDPSLVRFEEVVRPGANWSHVLKRGTTLRITDTVGDANVAMLLYNFELPSERLNLPDTLKCQHAARLTKGHCLYSDMGRILVSITEDTCGWHDPLAGWSTAKGVEQKYGVKTYQEARNEWHRNAHDNFVTELGKYGMDERDLAMNVNFFSKVAVSASGKLAYVADNSRPGAYVDLRSEMNTLVILNTCVHPLDTSTSYAPQPVKLTVWTSPPPGPDDFCRNSRPENQRGFTITERYFL
ncbi:MAG TPA: urea amidolyase associated protein UAAP1 [Chthoniobacter sp.]|nr:urea amidolyase associated protein UAAP1 [Chthoniobacter sp.]